MGRNNFQQKSRGGVTMTKQELQDKFDEIIDALPEDAYICGIIDTNEMPMIEDLAVVKNKQGTYYLTTK